MVFPGLLSGSTHSSRKEAVTKISISLLCCSARGSKEGIARSLRAEVGRLERDMTEYKWMLFRFALIQGLDILLTTVVVSRQQLICRLLTCHGVKIWRRNVPIRKIVGAGLENERHWEVNRLWAAKVIANLCFPIVEVSVCLPVDLYRQLGCSLCQTLFFVPAKRGKCPPCCKYGLHFVFGVPVTREPLLNLCVIAAKNGCHQGVLSWLDRPRSHRASSDVATAFKRPPFHVP